MADPTKPSPEQNYARLFPGQPIPAWALEKIDLLEEGEFIISEGGVELVPLAQVVGTRHYAYGGLRWLDMVTRGQKSDNFSLDNWPGFLNADTSDLSFVRIAGTTSYYLQSEGNHRLAALKLAGKNFLRRPVAVAHPRPRLEEVIPIRLWR